MTVEEKERLKCVIISALNVLAASGEAMETDAVCDNGCCEPYLMIGETFIEWHALARRWVRHEQLFSCPFS